MRINVQSDLRESIERLMAATSSPSETTTQYEISVALTSSTIINCIHQNIQGQRLIASFPKEDNDVQRS